MATKAPKKRRGKSKTRTIEEYLLAHPKATNSEVIEALKQKRVRVSSQLVYGARKKLGIKSPSGGGKTARRGKSSKAAVRRNARGTASSAKFSSDVLFAAKELVDAVGGFNQAKRALDTLANLR